MPRACSIPIATSASTLSPYRSLFWRSNKPLKLCGGVDATTTPKGSKKERTGAFEVGVRRRDVLVFSLESGRHGATRLGRVQRRSSVSTEIEEISEEAQYRQEEADDNGLVNVGRVITNGKMSFGSWNETCCARSSFSCIEHLSRTSTRSRW